MTIQTELSVENSMEQKDTNVEYFPLNGSTIGSKGTVPVTQTPVFEKDENGETVLSAKVGTSDQLLNLYVGTNEKVNLAVRNNAGVYTAIITTDETVGPNEWNFVAVKWQLSLKWII